MRARSLAVALALPLALAAQARADDLVSCDAAGVTRPMPANSHLMAPDDYPLVSVVLGEQGSTILEIVVQADGGVSDAKVSRSSGSLRLDDAARTIVPQRWRYTPATRAGKPVACRNFVAIAWRIPYEDFENGEGRGMAAVMKQADYPPGAYDKGESGATGLMIMGDLAGGPNKIVIIQPSGFADLDQAALALAARKAKLPSGEFDGKPMKSFMVLLVVWPGKGAAPK